jgi:hypothetical protein
MNAGKFISKLTQYNELKSDVSKVLPILNVEVRKKSPNARFTVYVVSERRFVVDRTPIMWGAATHGQADAKPANHKRS